MNGKMRNTVGAIGITIMLFCIMSYKYILPKVNFQTLAPDKKIILIDPGHGGIDGGAVSIRGFFEKNINLAIALKTRGNLEKLGYLVVMTRETDKGLYTKGKPVQQMKAEDLGARCMMKKESNCNLFISIHQNYFYLNECSGAQVWYSKNTESEKLAHILQEAFKRELDNGNNREEKPDQSRYKVLRCHTDIPSLIIECGFLSNYKEEEKLRADTYQDKVAEIISKAIDEYFNQDKIAIKL